MLLIEYFRIWHEFIVPYLHSPDVIVCVAIVYTICCGFIISKDRDAVPLIPLGLFIVPVLMIIFYFSPIIILISLLASIGSFINKYVERFK